MLLNIKLGSYGADCPRHSSSILDRTYIDPVIARPFLRPILWSPDTAALTAIYLATSTEPCEAPGKSQYFAPIARKCNTSEHARNMTLQTSLWQMTEQLVKKLRSQQ